MLKQLFTLFLLLISAGIMAQTVQPNYADTFIYKSRSGKTNIIFNLPTDSVANGVLTNAGGGRLEFRKGVSLTLPNGPVTSTPSVGFNPGTTDLVAWMTAAYFKAEAPAATISGGNQVELMAPGADLVYNLSWSATRKATTQQITSLMVGGIAQSTPGTITANTTRSGTQAVNVPRNVNTALSIIVTAADGQTATASTTVSFAAKAYLGWVSSTTPTDAELLATGGSFASNNTKVFTQPAPASPQYLAYAYPASFGLLTKCEINGFPALAAMGSNGTPITRNLVNASGYSQQYYIYVTSQAQSGATKIDAD
jgi:hypothetical protein